MENELIDLDHTAGAIEYSGCLVVDRGSLRIQLMEPLQGSSRASREFGSWRFFKLNIPKRNKIDEERLKAFLAQDIHDHLPLQKSSFILSCTCLLMMMKVPKQYLLLNCEVKSGEQAHGLTQSVLSVKRTAYKI